MEFGLLYNGILTYGTLKRSQKRRRGRMRPPSSVSGEEGADQELKSVPFYISKRPLGVILLVNAWHQVGLER
jgi:hypothetical protein